jgi:hypothetical protein
MTEAEQLREKADFDRAQAIKAEARAYVAKLGDQGRGIEVLQNNLSLMGVDFTKPIVRRQHTFSGVRFE